MTTTKAEKEAAKAAAAEAKAKEKAEKEAAKAAETSADGVEIGEPIDIRPKSLPLVVKLPADASPAQVEYAKVINAYAYQNPDKFKVKKDAFLRRLELLKDKDVPQGDQRLEINKDGQKGGYAFSFIKAPDGSEIYAGQNLPGTKD